MYTLLLALRIFGAGLLFLSILAGLAAAWQEGKVRVAYFLNFRAACVV